MFLQNNLAFSYFLLYFAANLEKEIKISSKRVQKKYIDFAEPGEIYPKKF